MTDSEYGTGVKGASDRFQPLFEHANDAIALVEFKNGSPVIDEINLRFRDTFVPDDANVTGRDLDEVIAAGGRKEAAKELTQQVQNGDVVRKSITRETVAGSRHFDWQVIPVDATTIESTDHAFAIYTDITERFERKRALAESEDRYRTLLAMAPNPIVIYSASEEIIYANDEAVELFGAETEEEVLGLTPHDFGPFDSRDELDERLHRLVEEKQEVPPNELTILDRDGREKTVLVASSPITYEGESAIQTVATDITEQKEREREVDETARQLQGVLDNVEAAIWIRDLDHRVKVVNQNYRDLFGIDESVNLVGRRPSEVHPEDVAAQFRENDRRVIDQEEPIEFEEVVDTVEGKRTYLTRMVPLSDDGQLYATCGVATDITELKRNQEELERINDQLEGVASIVSHDLQTPLAVASGQLELAREEHDNENLEAIKRSHDRMEALIEDILTLARKGQRVGELESVSLTELVEASWGIVETADATLAIETETSVRADTSRLQQLLENLIRNAVEHGGSGVKVTVGDLDDGFFVEDTGPGIPPEKREDVFEEGFTMSAEGTGFGLTIVKEIADGHGWDVIVTEGAEGGARFEFVGVETV